MTDVDSDLAIVGAAAVLRAIAKDTQVNAAQAAVFKKLLVDADKKMEELKVVLRERIKASNAGDAK